jgi:2-polyprenyl-3-methyl-5-hydroxy-6-metoxy-1,4-benzoquinol methylase
MYKGKDYLHGIPGEYYASKCLGCGLWFQNPRPINDDIELLYPSEYAPHKEIQPQVSHLEISSSRKEYLRTKFHYRHLRETSYHATDWKSFRIFDFWRAHQFGIELAPEFVEDGALLEIGCASGGRLMTLRTMGWHHLYGVELVPEAANRAKAEGFAVECGQIEHVIENYPDSYFDVIISSMVIEHLLNPFEIFKKIAKKLKPGGQFLFSTVVRDSLDAKIYGVYWGGFDFPRHMVYFKKKEILDALNKEFERIRYYHQNAPIDFVRSSTWLNNSGGGNILNSCVLNIAKSRYSKAIGLCLAFFKLTTRVSFSCKKKFD